MGYLTLSATMLLWSVFAVSATGKIRDRSSFAESLRLFFPAEVRAPAAILTGAELVIVFAFAGSLFDERLAMAGFALSAVLLVMFSAGIAIMIRRGSVAYCLCFGRTGTRFSRRHVIRNLLLVGVALAALLGHGDRKGLEPGGIAAALASALVLAALVILMDDLVEVFRNPDLPVPSRSRTGPSAADGGRAGSRVEGRRRGGEQGGQRAGS